MVGRVARRVVGIHLVDRGRADREPCEHSEEAFSSRVFLLRCWSEPGAGKGGRIEQPGCPGRNLDDLSGVFDCRTVDRAERRIDNEVLRDRDEAVSSDGAARSDAGDGTPWRVFSDLDGLTAYLRDELEIHRLRGPEGRAEEVMRE